MLTKYCYGDQIKEDEMGLESINHGRDDVVVFSLFNDAFSVSVYSVDFYSILIRLPSSSEAGETRVRNMAAEFCRRSSIVLVGFFYMP
jgi:hypothetical protein